jgi:hypothetical protein
MIRHLRVGEIIKHAAGQSAVHVLQDLPRQLVQVVASARPLFEFNELNSQTKIPKINITGQMTKFSIARLPVYVELPVLEFFKSHGVKEQGVVQLSVKLIECVNAFGHRRQ